MPSKWLLKSEPGHYSLADLQRDGQTVWDGVSNNLALKNLRMMRAGDLTLIYHTGKEKAIVGIAEVASDPYPDPKQKNPRLAVIDLKFREFLPRPVTLGEIRKQTPLRDFDLVRLPRLSVVPVSETQWKALSRLAQTSRPS
ncbi:MAG TPA: EVE domain-containing protein [Terriglobia bacterium]|nr:EVE domain-containing protein [Terriglobia bacterium]